MNISINGQSQVPPGFRFHPTEEELLQYYLRKKVAYQKIDLDVIGEVDLNKLEPWDIQEKCRIGSAPQNDWYLFSHKDKKYPTGMRTNRATAAGFWKATGRDKIIHSGCRRIGLRKTLVFYKGRAPHGHKSEWIMHEYRLDDSNQEQNALDASPVDINMTEEGWVVCRVFKKKNYQKSLDSPWSTSMSTSSIKSKIQMLCSSSNQNGVLDQILSYMGRKTCKVENETNVNLKNPENNDNDNCKGKIDIFMHLPMLNGPGTPPPPPISSSSPHFDQYQPFDETMFAEPEPVPAPSSDSATPETSELVPELGGLGHWATLDRLVASHLNGQDLPAESTGQYFCFGDHDENELVQLQQIQLNRLSDTQSPQTLAYESDFFWSNIMAKSLSSSSTSDPFGHLSV